MPMESLIDRTGILRVVNLAINIQILHGTGGNYRGRGTGPPNTTTDNGNCIKNYEEGYHLMGDIPAINQVRRGKRLSSQEILATGQKLYKASINEEGVLKNNLDD